MRLSRRLCDAVSQRHGARQSARAHRARPTRRYRRENPFRLIMRFAYCHTPGGWAHRAAAACLAPHRPGRPHSLTASCDVAVRVLLFQRLGHHRPRLRARPTQLKFPPCRHLRVRREASVSVVSTRSRKARVALAARVAGLSMARARCSSQPKSRSDSAWSAPHRPGLCGRRRLPHGLAERQPSAPRLETQLPPFQRTSHDRACPRFRTSWERASGPVAVT